MDGSLKTALQGFSVIVFTAIRIAFNTGPVLRLIDGSGSVTFNVDGVSETFTSSHTTYGVLASMESIEERVADEAPRFRFSAFPASEDAIAEWANIEEQGSMIQVYYGAVNETTGAVLGTPELVWKGRLDTVKTTIDANVMVVEVDSISAYERMFVAEEAARLNGVWHQSIWSGETGLDYIYAADETVYWGPGSGSTGGSSGGGGGRTFYGPFPKVVRE